LKEEKFKICPRCGKKILKSKTICSFCGAVIKEKQVDKTDEKLFKQKNKKKSPCPICGKPPERQTVCPNCGIEGICSFHIYKFFSDQVNSSEGCPKCGPRCSICGTQTSLITFKGRSVCTSCAEKLKSPEHADRERRRETADKIKKNLTTLITFIGLAVGIYLGLQLDMQKVLMNIIKFPVFKGIVVTVTWAFLGLIAGSLLAAIINAFIRAD